MSRYKDIWDKRIGELWGELTILEYVGNGKVSCLCSCGKKCTKRYTDMKKGRTKSCGHLKEQQKLPNLEGEKFNSLLAIKELDIVNGQRLYLFKCDCGKEVIRQIKEVKRGKVKSCGCGVINGIKRANTTHGMTNSRLYNIYRGMIDRCNNKKQTGYKNYGGRGIKVCDEWLSSFESFYEWAINNGYSEELSIDRINNDGNYEPSNCRWADSYTQQNNTSQNIVFEYDGKTQTLAEWARELNLSYYALWKRINKYGYSFEKAITHNIKRIKTD